MREICTSGLTRGEAIIPPLLYHPLWHIHLATRAGELQCKIYPQLQAGIESGMSAGNLPEEQR